MVLDLILKKPIQDRPFFTQNFLFYVHELRFSQLMVLKQQHTAYKNYSLYQWRGINDYIDSMLKSTHLLLRRFSFGFCQATSLKTVTDQLNVKRERAKWATKFMETIYFFQSSKSLKDPSLRDELLNCTISDPLYPEVETEMKEFFTIGKQLPSQVYNKDQIERAKHPKTKRFKFFPTYLVTQTIFKILKKGFDEQNLLYGYYGAGKTSSFILYCQLSKIVYCYTHELKIKNQYDIEKLRKQKIKPVSQTFYWCIQKSNLMKKAQQKSETEVLQDFSIRNQLKQALFASFTEDEKLKYSKYQTVQLLQQIQDKGQQNGSGFLPRIIIDQFNTVASIYQEKNAEINEILSKKQKYQYKSFLNQPSMKNVREVIYLLRVMKEIPFYRIFNTSVKVDLKLMKSKWEYEETEYARKHFEPMDILAKHPGIVPQQLPYEYYLKTQQGQIDFKHSVWHFLEERLEYFFLETGNQKEDWMKQRMSQIKQVFYHKIANYKLSMYFRLIHIRQTLEDATLSISLANLTNKQLSKGINDIQKAISSFLKSLKTFSYKSYYEKIINNFNQTDRSLIIEKLQLYFGLADYAESQRRRIQIEKGITLTDNQTVGGLAFHEHDTRLVIQSSKNKQLFKLFVKMQRQREIDKKFMFVQDIKYNQIVFSITITESQQFFKDLVLKALKILQASPDKISKDLLQAGKARYLRKDQSKTAKWPYKLCKRT